MPPQLALVVWFVLLVALFRFDGAQTEKVSSGLWVPVFWIAVIGSRLPSQWLGVAGRSAEQMTDGNSFDRYVYVILILLALSILSSRSVAWGQFVTGNTALIAILSFSLLSVAWSDFPFIAFKRWFRDLGTYLAVLVALTYPSPLEGVRMLLRRVCFLLVPLSIVFIKYFPEMGILFDYWTGEGYYIGVTTSKNMLGVLCLVSGLFFLWDTLTRWGDRKKPQVGRIILVNVAFFAMTLWLLSKSSSATSSVCLVLGSLIIAVAHTKTVYRYPALLTVSIPAGVVLYVLLQFVFEVDVMGALAEAVGRDPDLTGRTHIWSVVRAAGANPLIGTGYESFWLGPRLQWVWEQAGRVNEAHNGFLEVYLTLGLIGLGLYVVFLIASYRVISKKFIASPGFGSLSLALWTVLIFYNVTESALRGHLMWVAFLLGAVALPAPMAAQAEGPNLERELTRRHGADRGFQRRRSSRTHRTERPSLRRAAVGPQAEGQRTPIALPRGRFPSPVTKEPGERFRSVPPAERT